MYLRSKPRPLCGFQVTAPSGFIFTGWQDEYSFLSHLQSSYPFRSLGTALPSSLTGNKFPRCLARDQARGPVVCFRSLLQQGPSKALPEIKKKEKKTVYQTSGIFLSGFLKKKTKKIKSSISISAWTHNFQTENYQLLKTKIQPGKSEDVIGFTDYSWNRKPSVQPLEGCSRGCVNGRSL